MRRTSLLGSAFVCWISSFALFGCGGSKDGVGTCPGGAFSCGQRCEVDTPPTGCGDACDGSTPCPAGFYCSTDGTCTSDCVASGDTLCPNGVCSADGVCSQPPPDAGNGNGDAGPDAGTDANVCARDSVQATAVTPNVILIIDRSGSMAYEFDVSDGIQCNDPPGCPGNNSNHSCYVCGLDPTLSRWDSLRASLVGTQGSLVDVGLIGDLQDQVRFGAATFQGPQNMEPCFTVANFSPSPSDASKIGVVDVGDPTGARSTIADGTGRYFDANPASATPTGSSIQYILDNLGAEVTGSTDPTIFILATDGAPNEDAACYVPQDLADPMGTAAASDLESATNAIQHAFGAGIRTFVLAVADETQLSQTNVDQMANAGVGKAVDASPAAQSWRITSVAALNDALQTIIQGEISCTVNLQGSVPEWMTGCATDGNVEFVDSMGGRTTVPCDGTNGWSLTGPSTMQLNGTSCDTLKTTPGLTLDASFPCGTVIIIPG